MTTAVSRFRFLAESYCQLVESAESEPADELLARLHRLLPALVATVQELPEVESASDETGPDISQADWSSRFAALNAALGERGTYWTTGEPEGLDEPELLNLPLADDLADIWRDLKSTLLHLDSGGRTEDVVWQWHFDFKAHWGSHAVEALRAVRAAVSQTP